MCAMWLTGQRERISFLFLFANGYVCVRVCARQVWDYVMLYSFELWRALFCITGGPVHPAESALCEV